MDPRTGAALAVERAMTNDEKTLFLEHFLRDNPRWRGAGVSDVLVNLDDSDAMLPLVETMHALHHSDVREPGLLSMATYAVAYTYGVRTAGDAWPNAHSIIETVRTNEAVAGETP